MRQPAVRDLPPPRLDALGRDLLATTTDPETTGRDGHDVEVIFLGENGQTTDNGRCRQRLGRSFVGNGKAARYRRHRRSEPAHDCRVA